MPGLTVKVVLQDVTRVESEAVVVGFFEDVRPLKGLAGQLDWVLCGSLSNLKNAARTAAASVAGAGASSAAFEYLRPPRTAHESGVPALQEGLSEGAGGRSLTVSLLAPDKAAYDELSRLVANK